MIHRFFAANLVEFRQKPKKFDQKLQKKGKNSGEIRESLYFIPYPQYNV